MEKINVNVKNTAELLKWLGEVEIPKKSYQSYMLPENCRFERLMLEHNDTGMDDDGYCWSLTPRWSLTGQVGYIFPMASGDFVKFFQTIGGAKRRLAKQMQDYSWLFQGEEAQDA